MNIQLLKRLYSIYSPSGKEQKMVKFLCSYIRQLPGNISVSKDKFGNLYVVKGRSGKLSLFSEPYRPGFTLQAFKGFQGGGDQGSHIRLFLKEQEV